MKTLIKLAFQSIRYRKATLILSIISVSLSVILLLGVERLRSNVHKSFTSTISGTDLIVGARTGNISLLLSTIFHMGYPNQNVSWKTYEQVSSLNEVSWSIPLSLGDSHKGFSVIGTNGDFFRYFKYGEDQNLSVQFGTSELDHQRTVLGAKVARELGYKVGDALIVTHGMGQENFVSHEDAPFEIVGILKATGTPVDQSIFVSLSDLDAIHSHFYRESPEDFDVFAGENPEDQHDHDHHHDHQAEFNHGKQSESISGFLLGITNKKNILSVQRMLNEFKTEPLTAIMPVVTLVELWSIVRPIEKTLIVISLLVLVVALGGIITILMITLNERRREMAILRSVGATPYHIFGLIILETFGIILVGIITGTIFMHFILLMSKPIIAAKLGLAIDIGSASIQELLIISSVLIVGGLGALLPAYKSYRNSMIDGLTINK